MSKIVFLTLIIAVLNGCPNTPENMQIPENFSWQGHRGARGLLPENTVPAFLKAQELGMGTLELDIAVSRDSQIIVTHEPWFSAEICLNKNGNEITEEEGKKLRIYEMTAAEIAEYDCGSKAHTRFAEQEKMPAYKPTLRAVVEAADAYAREHNLPLPAYNIEIKSEPDYDGVLTPPIADFVALTVKELRDLGIDKRGNLQSFDLRALEEIHKQAPDIAVAYLVEAAVDTEAALNLLTFKPEIYSPYYPLVNQKMRDLTRARGIKIIPWTVNDTVTMKKLIALGVDGIITDYPNRAAQIEGFSPAAKR